MGKTGTGGAGDVQRSRQQPSWWPDRTMAVVGGEDGDGHREDSRV